LDLLRRHVEHCPDNRPQSGALHRRSLLHGGHRDGARRSAQLRETEVQELGVHRRRAGTAAYEKDVGWLEVAMDDAQPMRRVKAVCELDGDPHGEVDRERTSVEARGERFALEKRHHEVVHAERFPDVVDPADVRVIELGDGTRLALEPRAAIGIVGQ
jgi:hypothetical protein